MRPLVERLRGRPGVLVAAALSCVVTAVFWDAFVGGLVFFERDVPSKYRQRGVRQGRFKLVIVTPGPGDPGPGAPPEAEPEPSLRPGVALYDLAEDPEQLAAIGAELTPLVDKLPKEFREGPDVVRLDSPHAVKETL